MSILHRFHREHGKIQVMMGELESLGVASEKGREKLASLEDLVLEHLREEERVLYPRLWELANQDHDLLQELEKLHEALEGFSMTAADFFFQIHRATSTHQVEAAFAGFKAGLMKRMAWEEKVIPRLLEAKAV